MFQEDGADSSSKRGHSLSYPEGHRCDPWQPAKEYLLFVKVNHAPVRMKKFTPKMAIGFRENKTKKLWLTGWSRARNLMGS